MKSDGQGSVPHVCVPCRGHHGCYTDDSALDAAVGGGHGPVVEAALGLLAQRHYEPSLEDLSQDLPGLDGLSLEEALPVGQEITEFTPDGLPVERSRHQNQAVRMLELSLKLGAAPLALLDLDEERGQGTTLSDGFGEAAELALNPAELPFELAPTVRLIWEVVPPFAGSETR